MGIIYKITCNETGECYIGSCKDIRLRMNKHRCLKDNRCESRHIISRGNWKYDILETNELDERELLVREQYYLNTIDNINKCDAIFQGVKKRNKEQEAAYRKTQYDKINTMRRSQPTIICECGGSYKKESEARHFRTKKHSDYVLSLGVED